jgi:GYD domain
VLGPVVEAAGGKLHGYWYAFGDADRFVLIEARDDVMAAGLLVKVASTGAFTNVWTSKLLTVEEALDALRRGGGVEYRAPGAPESSYRVCRAAACWMPGSPDRNSLGRHPTCCELWSAVRLIDFRNPTRCVELEDRAVLTGAHEAVAGLVGDVLSGCSLRPCAGPWPNETPCPRTPTAGSGTVPPRSPAG